MNTVIVPIQSSSSTPKSEVVFVTEVQGKLVMDNKMLHEGDVTLYYNPSTSKLRINWINGSKTLYTNAEYVSNAIVNGYSLKEDKGAEHALMVAGALSLCLIAMAIFSFFKTKKDGYI